MPFLITRKDMGYASSIFESILIYTDIHLLIHVQFMIISFVPHHHLLPLNLLSAKTSISFYYFENVWHRLFFS